MAPETDISGTKVAKRECGTMGLINPYNTRSFIVKAHRGHSHRSIMGDRGAADASINSNRLWSTNIHHHRSSLTVAINVLLKEEIHWPMNAFHRVLRLLPFMDKRTIGESKWKRCVSFVRSLRQGQARPRPTEKTPSKLDRWPRRKRIRRRSSPGVVILGDMSDREMINGFSLIGVTRTGAVE